MNSNSSNNADEARQLAKSYMRRTGMSPQDLAHRVGYRYVTLTQFLNGTYRRGPGSKEAAISEAVTRFIATAHNDTAEEFHGKLYEIGNVRVMREVFRRVLDRPCILLAYAPPGSGKTDVARALMPQYATEGVHIFRVYCRAGITPRDLMRRVATACGSVGDYNTERTISNLRYDYAGKRVALYLDEAQHLSVECLETVRELYDELHWSLVFAGSHQLDRIFTKWAGDLEQFERRVADKITLPAVSSEEAENIVRSELPGLAVAKIRSVVERSHVDIRADGAIQRYLSIGRVMANVRELQQLLAETDPHADVVEI
jgi:DNA transposition AAA+ family ATPase